VPHPDGKIALLLGPNLIWDRALAQRLRSGDTEGASGVPPNANTNRASMINGTRISAGLNIFDEAHALWCEVVFIVPDEIRPVRFSPLAWR